MKPEDVLAKQRQLSRARHAARVQRLNSRVKGARKPHTSKRAFIEAMAGTGGVKTEIAKNLGVRRKTVRMLLERPEWTDVRELYEEECMATDDIAETTLRHAMTQTKDMATAAATAKWWIGKRQAAKFGDVAVTVIQGGDKPVQLAATVTAIPVTALDISLDTRRALLEAYDRRDAEREASDIAASAVKPNARRLVEALPAEAVEAEDNEINIED